MPTTRVPLSFTYSISLSEEMSDLESDLDSDLEYKQFARDWLKNNPDNDWTLPEDIVEKTINKYLSGYEMLTGEKRFQKKCQT